MDYSNDFDYEGAALSKLISFDRSFLNTYITKLFETDKEYISSRDIHGEFTKLWKQDDFESIFLEIIELVYEVSKENRIWREGALLKSFFSYPQGDNNVHERVDSVIKRFIELFYNDEKKMTFIFELIAELSYEKRIEFVLHFIDKNDSFEIFKKLTLEPSLKSWSGSRVPYLQKDKDFYNSLLQYMYGIKFLEHRHEIEKQILYIEDDIKNEKKKDFMDDY